MGLGVSPIVRPWDDLASAMQVPSYYGLEPVSSDPVRASPVQYPSGGIIYFEDGHSWDRLKSAFILMGVNLDEREYGVFQGQSQDPVRERYLDQVRITSKAGLGQLFGIGKELEQIPTQPISIESYIMQFFNEQNAKWNGRDSEFRLSGTAGGDGDWAKERLAFGFMVENQYWGVYRLWSRAWLITK
jgi:hypothetical protein